jgi:biotin synthase
MKSLVNRLRISKRLEASEYQALLTTSDIETLTYLAQCAREVSQEHFENKIYIRGLIELSSYCKKDCYYCGIRRSNSNAKRYRLNEEEILACCNRGYALGFRTFVLQSGEDGYYTDEKLVPIVEKINKLYPDCAITLSLGERSEISYKRLYEAGATRYLLRHETANAVHYSQLHPSKDTLASRIECLLALKEIGYQVGTGMMIGSPYQTLTHLLEDLKFLSDFKPHMIGIGPYLSHKDTPFCQMPNGSLDLTLRLLSILRLMFPTILLPATTALGTLHPNGREKGILAGANVVMPNLSPVEVRRKYSLYDNKICTGEEAAESKDKLQKRMQEIGYTLVVDKGDYRPF